MASQVPLSVFCRDGGKGVGSIAQQADRERKRERGGWMDGEVNTVERGCLLLLVKGWRGRSIGSLEKGRRMTEGWREKDGGETSASQPLRRS